MIISIVLLAFAFRPDAFDRWRAPRLAAVASLLPIGAYVAQTMIA